MLIAQSGLHLTISGGIILFFLALILAWWGIFTLIIRYHWKNYSIGGVQVFTMNFFYMIGSIAFIILTVGSALLYLLSTP